MARLRSHSCLFAAAVLTVAAGGVGVAAPPSAPTKAEVERVVKKVNELLEARWQADQLRPAEPADDASFLRRVTLDLTGTIPSVSEVRDFLDDTSADKRRRLVERLLTGQSYPAHFGNFWRSAWLPDPGNQFFPPQVLSSFEAWARTRLSENAGYDQMVREILTVNVPQQVRGGVDFEGGVPLPTGASPAAFYQLNEGKPENLAASTSRLFLGVRLECAQCHNHFFAKWKREDFWQYAAFFSGPRGGNRREITIPGANTVVKARFPDGGDPAWKDGATPAAVLAEWMTKPENPYFARAAVNRVWSHFFAAGLIDPVDDIPEGEKNAVLDLLAKEFAAAKYDLKFLIRVLVGTRAYQLSSAGPREIPDGAPYFTRMSVKGMSPEQVLASLTEATGLKPLDTAGMARNEVVSSFGRGAGGRPVAPSIPQALALMNGKFVNDATSLDRSATLTAVANAPFLDTSGKIETLFLAALGRKPTAEESSWLVRYVKDGGPSRDSKRALADVYWAVLNTSEFILNH